MATSGSEITPLRNDSVLRKKGMTDRLTEIMTEMLAQTHDLEETAANLIRRAAGAYAVELLEIGQIPFNFIDDVLTDLESEATEIYRKKTYGHLSLQEYRTTKKPRKRKS